MNKLFIMNTLFMDKSLSYLVRDLLASLSRRVAQLYRLLPCPHLWGRVVQLPWMDALAGLERLVDSSWVH